MDVVIYLGAPNDGQGRLSPMARARADAVLSEYRSRPGSRVLLTGAFGSFNPTGEPHVHYVKEYLREQGAQMLSSNLP